MKKNLLSVGLFVLVSTGFCQQSLNRKRGIYLSFEQLANNNPAVTDSFDIKERTKGNIVLTGGGKYTFDLLSGSKQAYKLLRKDMVGISDGTHFYISDKYSGGGWQGLTICILSGPYIIAKTQGSDGQYTGGGIIPSLIKIESGYLINLQTGKSVPISNKVLKELLAPYPEIAKKYSVTAGLTSSLVQIVSDINKEMNAK